MAGEYLIDANPERRERVGLVVVHGIGEQRRFEHVDAQVREIIRAIRAREAAGGLSEVTVEVYKGQSASFQSEQDTWATGDEAPIKAVVRDAPTGKLLEIHFHEVWWADSNEPYSLSKQVRFWAWGLIIGFIPMKRHSTHAGAASTRDPRAPGGRTKQQRLWVRARLFGVSVVAVLGAASIGLFTFLAKRLFNLDPPDFVKVFVNYVAGVKLYNQKQRRGSGFPAQNADFLEDLGEPPRITVRRRMIRALAQAACADYDRWYVVAHSLGTVVAFNGLMESAYTWPGYFDEQGWNKLVANGFAGGAREGWEPPEGIASPRRPVWAEPRHIAYRSAVFYKLHGVLFMGSPLEKFATLWPGRVPIATEPAFRTGTTWLNIYDPIDPVSGVLRAFDTRCEHACPQPETIGYASDWKFFISHIRYLTWTPGGGTLADGLADWLITGTRRKIGPEVGCRWFRSPIASKFAGPRAKVNSSRHYIRTCAAWCWWLGAIIVLALLSGITLPRIASALKATTLVLIKDVAASTVVDRLTPAVREMPGSSR